MFAMGDVPLSICPADQRGTRQGGGQHLRSSAYRLHASSDFHTPPVRLLSNPPLLRTAPYSHYRHFCHTSLPIALLQQSTALFVFFLSSPTLFKNFSSFLQSLVYLSISMSRLLSHWFGLRNSCNLASPRFFHSRFFIS